MALKKCKECDSEVSSKADACPKCGAKIKKTSVAAMGCLTLIVGFFGIAAIGAIFGDSTPRETSSSTPAAPSAAPQPAALEAPAPKEELRYISDSCKDVAKNFGPSSKLTDLQKKAIWEQEQLKGVHFEWTLKVQSVDTTFGQIKAQFKCKGSRALVSDVILGVDDEKLALQLVKGNNYKVHGTLSDWGNFLGLSGDLVEVLE